MLTSIRLQNFKGHRDTTVPPRRMSVLQALLLPTRLAQEFHLPGRHYGPAVLKLEREDIFSQIEPDGQLWSLDPERHWVQGHDEVRGRILPLFTAAFTPPSSPR